MQGVRAVGQRRSTMWAGVAAALALAVALLAQASPAMAHDRLVDASPSKNSVLDVIPADITLSFSATPSNLGLAIKVTGPDGAEYAAGEPILDGTTVRQSLKAEAPAGDYRVDWRVVSSDGHPISGTIDFTVETSTLPVAPEPEPAEPADPAAPETPLTPEQSGPEPWVIVLVAVAGLAAIAGLIAMQSRRRQILGDDPKP